MGMWSMGKLNYAYHLYYGAMNNQERIAPNKLLQPTVYAVSIVCMLAALSFWHTIATAYTAAEQGVMHKRGP